MLMSRDIRPMVSEETMPKRSTTARAATKKEEVFPIPGDGVVKLPATINGMRGTFVFDTGASFVTLKSRFALKAKVEVEQDSHVQLNTPNGIAEGKRGRAKIVQ